MSPELTQLMAGGALAIIILDRVFGLIKPLVQKPQNGNSAGAQDKNYWIVISQQLLKESIVPLVDILLRLERNQTEQLKILSRVRNDQKRREDEED
jgi:hypothetical protein